jgi:ABC-2 type transport system permease protein
VSEQAALPMPQLRDNSGPQAFGGDLRRYWILVKLNAVAEFKLVYAGSVLGYFWTLARPLAMFAIIYLVFTEFLGVGGGIANYPAVLLINLLIFQFFADATNRSVQSMVMNESTLRKMEFPRAVIPSAVVLTAAFSFVLNFIAVGAILIFTGIEPRLTWLLLPPLWLLLTVLTTALCFILSTLFVRFRDIAQIWAVLSLALFYTSPVMYPAEIVPEQFRWILIVNPLAPIFELTRKWAVDPSAPVPAEAAGTAWGLWGPVLMAVAICFVAVMVFRRRARDVAELL